MTIYKLTLALLSLLAVSVFPFSEIRNASGVAVPLTAAHNNVATKHVDNELAFGNFSVSLAVKDIKASKEFYEKLDFKKVGGDVKLNFVIMQNGTTNIGLFQGMFKDNIMTFNPGWNHKSEKLDEFQDVRDLQAALKKRGITPIKAADEKSKGPASFVVADPDGNSILIDQHVPKP